MNCTELLKDIEALKEKRANYEEQLESLGGENAGLNKAEFVEKQKDIDESSNAIFEKYLAEFVDRDPEIFDKLNKPLYKLTWSKDGKRLADPIKKIFIHEDDDSIEIIGNKAKADLVNVNGLMSSAEGKIEYQPSSTEEETKRLVGEKTGTKIECITSSGDLWIAGDKKGDVYSLDVAANPSFEFHVGGGIKAIGALCTDGKSVFASVGSKVFSYSKNEETGEWASSGTSMAFPVDISALAYDSKNKNVVVGTTDGQLYRLDQSSKPEIEEVLNGIIDKNTV
ncbi:hypothetical protein J6S46_01225 [Candidatus Saccharibacteria bacterium]|nr:hypothetical protein [Candidatus Saccharibacteria bacterium]